NSESLLGFLSIVFLIIVYLLYRTTSLGIVVFPIVFLLTFIAATGSQPALFVTPVVKKGWLIAHIALIFTGYAALFVSFGASLLYLVQERHLKSKKPGLLGRLPALGTVVAQSTYGRVDFLDPKIALSVLMWAVYLVMLYTRWSSGWRGRRAALMATIAFVAAVLVWAANYFGGMHRFV